MKSEIDLVEWLRRISPKGRDFLSGIGDDCALVKIGARMVIMKTDQCVEGNHFLPGTPPALIGRKAFNRVASDFAAAGGSPHFFLMTVAVSRKSIAWARMLVTGAINAARKCGAVLVGGDITRTTGPLVITISAVGTPFKKFVTRSGATPGSKIYVSGTLGGSIQGKHLKFSPRIELARSLVCNHRIEAMCDISDGFVLDLHRICTASDVAARLNLSRLPVSRCLLNLPKENAIQRALYDGEDYELIVISKEKLPGLYEVGCIERGKPMIRSESGNPIPVRGHLFMFDKE